MVYYLVAFPNELKAFTPTTHPLELETLLHSQKRITFNMMILVGCQKIKEIRVIAQCPLNTVKTFRHEQENCNGNYEATVS
nr:hypothetical protein HmN_000434100 [Hymenolepis microstoma]